jgi:hypothetical protein
VRMVAPVVGLMVLIMAMRYLPCVRGSMLSLDSHAEKI